MLLFIQRLKTKERRPLQFQYISCYSLSSSTIWNNSRASVSIHLMLLFIHCDWLAVDQPYLFQYISCYSLSITETPCWYNIQMFQYISCYSLSIINLVRINNFVCFNTSHVTLYLYVKLFVRGFFDVSIHLMLLFII